LFEELIYDEDGNILNGSLMDYLVPTAVAKGTLFLLNF
jgi:carbon-monoxide dehydrogenase large subunit